MNQQEITELTDKQIVDEYKRRMGQRRNGRCTFCGDEQFTRNEMGAARAKACKCEHGHRIGMFRDNYGTPKYFGH